jgi:2,3-dihydroxyethylbenzene 1,2-dioxygenase
MSQVTELGYLGFGVSNLARWKEYATEVIGAEWIEQQGVGYMRVDLWHHRIALHADASDDLLYMGWRVHDAAALRAMAEKLKAAGIAFEEASEAQAAQRRVLGLLKLVSPGGIAQEIFCGPQIDIHRPFHPGRPLYGRFKTADDLGFGHVAIRESGTAVDFFRVLGLQGDIEYKVDLPGGAVATPVFMHCNQRQHSIAFGLGPMPKRCHHLMFEYTEVHDMGQASDIARRKRLRFTMGIGTHANDGALSFYTESPSGWQVELGWGVRPPSPHAQYYVEDVFGHGVGENLDEGGYGIGADK